MILCNLVEGSPSLRLLCTAAGKADGAALCRVRVRETRLAVSKLSFVAALAFVSGLIMWEARLMMGAPWWLSVPPPTTEPFGSRVEPLMLS